MDKEALKRLNIDESFEMNDGLKLPNMGMQIHSEYTMLAHFKLIAELTSKASSVQCYFDQDSGIRAAFIFGFKEFLAKQEQKRVNGFYVKFSKSLSVTEKRRLHLNSEKRLKEFCSKNSLSETDAKLAMIESNIAKALEVGKWKDRWVEHPISTMNEPDKWICHLNDTGSLNLKELAWLYLPVSLHGVDRFFMQSRRMVSYLERPVQSASNSGYLWNGYNAYNPHMIVKETQIKSPTLVAMR